MTSHELLRAHFKIRHGFFGDRAEHTLPLVESSFQAGAGNALTKCV